MSLAVDIAALRADGRVAEVNAILPYAHYLGIVSGFEGEELITRLPFREDHIGNFTARIFHGGIVGALMEQAAFVHLLHHVKRNQLPKVINLSANYLRPVAPRDVIASGVIVRQGARVANVRVRAWQQSFDEPVATADVHFLLPKPKDQS
ncbi:MAG: PaaI family thioesterase [Rhodospirillaceae bacterium]